MPTPKENTSVRPRHLRNPLNEGGLASAIESWRWTYPHYPSMKRRWARKLERCTSIGGQSIHVGARMALPRRQGASVTELYSRERSSREGVSPPGRYVSVGQCRPAVEGVYGEPGYVIAGSESVKTAPAATSRATACKTEQSNRTISSRASRGRDRIPNYGRSALMLNAGRVPRWRGELSARAVGLPPMWGSAVKRFGIAPEVTVRLASRCREAVVTAMGCNRQRAFLSLSCSSGLTTGAVPASHDCTGRGASIHYTYPYLVRPWAPRSFCSPSP